MRANRRYAFLRVSIRDSRAALLSANYHTARATTLIGIRLSVRRDFRHSFHRSRRDDSAEREQGKKRLDTAMAKVEFAGAKPNLVAVKETKRTTPIDRLITA